MKNKNEDNDALIRQGAKAILSWGTSLAEDYHESILEEIIPEELGNETFWEIAQSAQSLAESATFDLKDHTEKDLWNLIDAIKEEIKGRNQE